ncbi:MAG TPA: hypothetical protein VER96_12405 [Polyangiaceae bacterium]|nr:hypothetical protein [Polyangiaceae bacterium]
MSDLKHWLDESSDADEFERSILRAGLEGDPPQTTQDRVWSSLMGTLAVAPVLAATASVEAASAKAAAVGVGKASAVWLAVAKGFVVGLAVYGASAGVSEISNRVTIHPAPVIKAARVSAPFSMPRGIETPTASPTAALVPTSEEAQSRDDAAPRVAPHASASANPTPASRESNLPSVASFDDSTQPSTARVSQLEGETRALRRARDELRAGRLSDALATLEASQRQFSVPELYQEREALLIELLYRTGQRSSAAQRAHAFLSRFPESPHAQQVRQFTPR